MGGSDSPHSSSLQIPEEVGLGGDPRSRPWGLGYPERGRGGEGGVTAGGPGHGHDHAALALQLLGLWDSPRSRALLPGLLRADRSHFSARRDVSRRCRLRPGHYLVVPSAARAGDEADFTLRVFSERRHTAV